MNVLTIEDDTHLTRSMTQTFQKYGFINRMDSIASYNDYEQKSGDVSSYDIVLLDIDLGDGYKTAGMSILEQIRRSNSNIPIIMISSHSEYSYLEKAFLKGAHDYIVKPFRNRELQIRIERWFRNYLLSEYFTTARYVDFGDLRYAISAHEFYFNGDKIILSRSSKYILSLFMAYKERLVSQSFLEEKIWGYSDDVKQKNLRIKIMRLKQSLQPYGIDDWIQTVRGEGFIFKIPSQI